MRWSVSDIVVASTLAVASGVIFWGWNLSYHFVGSLFAFYPPVETLVHGMWLFPAVLGALIIRKPGAAIYCEMVAAAVSALLGSQWGLTVLSSGFMQGLGAELIFLAVMYRRFSIEIALLGGAASGLTGGITYHWIVPMYAYAPLETAIHIGCFMLSGAIVAGLLPGWAPGRSPPPVFWDRWPRGRRTANLRWAEQAPAVPSDPAAVRPSTRTTTPQAPSAGAQVLARGWTWHHPDRDSPAVAGLDLQIRPGEKVLIAGPSGAGKSTLLHGLAGVLQDQGAEAQGDLLIDGARPEEARGRAGLMQQDPAAAVVLSRLSDDVAFGPENLAVPRDEIPDRVAEALRAVGLGHLPVTIPPLSSPAVRSSGSHWLKHPRDAPGSAAARRTHRQPRP